MIASISSHISSVKCMMMMMDRSSIAIHRTLLKAWPKQPSLCLIAHSYSILNICLIWDQGLSHQEKVKKVLPAIVLNFWQSEVCYGFQMMDCFGRNEWSWSFTCMIHVLWFDKIVSLYSFFFFTKYNRSILILCYG